MMGGSFGIHGQVLTVHCTCSNDRRTYDLSIPVGSLPGSFIMESMTDDAARGLDVVQVMEANFTRKGAALIW